MTIIYDEKDLVTFGEYLLSKKRNDRIAANWSEDDNISLEERQSQVYHADVEKWKQQALEVHEA